MPPRGFDNGREDALHEYVFSQNLDELRGNPAAVMNVMEQYMSRQGHFMTFKPSKIEVALQTLRKFSPKTVVELGTYVGFSALAWGKMLKDFHSNVGGCKVVSMELSENFVRIARDIIQLAGLNEVVEVVHGQSANSLYKLDSFGIDKIDYLFIDHWEKFYLPDLKLCEDLKLLHSGSVIIADNTDIPGAPDYVQYVRAGGDGGYRYTSTTLPTRGEAGHPNILEVTTVI